MIEALGIIVDRLSRRRPHKRESQTIEKIGCVLFYYFGGTRMSKSVSFLYKLARLANDVEKLSSGDPKKIARRAKNKYIGKKIIRKVWKFPW